jgi:cytochrome oxidase Cu insertion factor (SCO1/SenC/PrrC family)
MPRFVLPAFALLFVAVAGVPNRAQAEPQQPSGQQLRDLPEAPKVGDRLPDFSVTDQNGRQVSFHEARGGRKAYLLVVRSASW